MEFNEHYEITLQSEKEVAFLNVPISRSHFSKLLYIHQQGRREGERAVNEDFSLSVVISDCPLEADRGDYRVTAELSDCFQSPLK